MKDNSELSPGGVFWNCLEGLGIDYIVKIQTIKLNDGYKRDDKFHVYASGRKKAAALAIHLARNWIDPQMMHLHKFEVKYVVLKNLYVRRK